MQQWNVWCSDCIYREKNVYLVIWWSSHAVPGLIAAKNFLKSIRWTNSKYFIGVSEFQMLRYVNNRQCKINTIRIRYLVIDKLSVLHNLLEYPGSLLVDTHKIFLTPMGHQSVLLAPWLCYVNCIKMPGYRLHNSIVFSWLHRAT